MNFLRHGYTAPCRFFRDNESVEGTIKWLLNGDRLPAIGRPTRIRPLIWCPFPWEQEGVGEVYNGWREYHRETVPAVMKGGHVCGTDEDFAEGGEYLPDEPPVKRDRNGYPLCCQPPFVGLGGAVGSGTADVEVIGGSYLATYWGSFTGGAPVGFLDEVIPQETWLGVSGPGAGFWTLTSPLYLGNGYWEFKTNLAPFCVYRTGADWDGLTPRTFALHSGSPCGASWFALP